MAILFIITSIYHREENKPCVKPSKPVAHDNHIFDTATDWTRQSIVVFPCLDLTILHWRPVTAAAVRCLYWQAAAAIMAMANIVRRIEKVSTVRPFLEAFIEILQNFARTSRSLETTSHLNCFTNLRSSKDFPRLLPWVSIKMPAKKRKVSQTAARGSNKDPKRSKARDRS